MVMRRFRRDKDHRKALLVNLTKNLIKHQFIKTTLSKAKDLRRFAEPILTRSKVNSLHNKRLVAEKLMNDWDITKILFENIGEKIKDRAGGYLRIVRLNIRKGDGATTALVQFVDMPKLIKNNKKSKNKEESSQEDILNETLSTTASEEDLSIE